MQGGAAVTRERHPGDSPSLAGAESYSKARLEALSAATVRARLPFSTETRKRLVLFLGCVAFVLVISYARATGVSRRRADMVLEWQAAAAAIASNKTAALPLAASGGGKDKGLANGAPAAYIPRLLHQTWAGEGGLPPQYEPAVASCRERHPASAGWEVRLWTDEDNRKLINDHYPWLSDLYSSLGGPEPRGALATYLRLLQYGGVAVDVAAHCARPLDDLLKEGGGRGSGGRVLLLSWLDPDSGAPSVSPAVMASEPGQEFWSFVVAKVASYFHLVGEGQLRPPADVTGARMLHRAALHYQYMHRSSPDVALLPAGAAVGAADLVAAMLANSSLASAGCDLSSAQAFSTNACSAAFPGAYAFVLPAQAGPSTAGDAAAAGSDAMTGAVGGGTGGGGGDPGSSSSSSSLGAAAEPTQQHQLVMSTGGSMAANSSSGGGNSSNGGGGEGETAVTSGSHRHQ